LNMLLHWVIKREVDRVMPKIIERELARFLNNEASHIENTNHFTNQWNWQPVSTNPMTGKPYTLDQITSP